MPRKLGRNDGFDTRRPDVEREHKHYKDQFRDKVVLCNGNEPHVQKLGPKIVNEHSYLKRGVLKMTKSAIVVCVSLGVAMFASVAAGQTPPPEEGEIVRITTELVQMDVVVNDKKGRPVKDLGPDDFTILQDGKSQNIVAVTYVDAATGEKTRTTLAAGKKGERHIPAPPVSPRSRKGRIITFVIDDSNCLSTVSGSANMRDAVLRFIDKNMLPDDRVAIYRTAGGSSLMQVYTSNKDALRRIVNRTRLLPSMACGSAFEPLRDNSTIKVTGRGAASFENEDDKKARIDRQNIERRNQVFGTVGVLQFIVERLKSVPQRKMVFLVSEGIAAKFDDGSFDALRELADSAARSSIVIHTLGARGINERGFLAAEDEVLPGIIGGTDNTIQASNDREEEARLLNAGLSYLSYATGGRFVRNSNRLEEDTQEILEANSGYYLIAYEPDGESFKGKEFHTIDVRVSTPELKVTSRKGFYGRSDQVEKAIYRTPDSPLFQAIASPLEDNGIDLRLTMHYGNSSSSGDYLRAIFHLPGSALLLAPQPDGSGKASLDVVGVILDEKGKVVNEFNRTYSVKIPVQGVRLVEKRGFDFSTDLSVKKPGNYIFRIAVRENNSKRLGSAGDFFIVPEYKKGAFFIAGLSAGGLGRGGSALLPGSRPIDSAFAPVFFDSTHSVRRFERGSELVFSYTIYNASISKLTRKPDLTREARLYLNGELVETVEEAPIEVGRVSDIARIEDQGQFSIPDVAVAGDYVLQVIVRDRNAKKTASQWIDFEVLP